MILYVPKKEGQHDCQVGELLFEFFNGEDECFHYLLCLLLSGLQWWTIISSPVTVCSKILGFLQSVPSAVGQFAHTSANHRLVGCLGTHLAQTLSPSHYTLACVDL